MTLKVRMSRAHQITVPAAVRAELHLGAGDLHSVQVRDGMIVLISESIDPIEALKGLHREIWQGVDVQGYIDQERDRW